VDLDLHLYSEEITPTADNDAFAISDADNQFCVGVVPIRGINYGLTGSGTNSVAHVEIDLPIVLTSGIRHLYGQLASVDAPTFAAIDDITIAVTTQQF